MHAAYRLGGAHLASMLFAICLAFNFVIAPSAHAFDDVTWTATGGDQSWSNGGNWSLGMPPTATDRAIFTDAGAVSKVGVTTSVLDADRKIGNLEFANGVELHQTIDLDGHQLRVRDLLGVNNNFYGNTTETIRNGSVVLGTSDEPGQLHVGTGSISALATLDLSDTRLDAALDSLQVGAASGSAFRGGTLKGGSSGDIVVGSKSQPGRLLVGIASDNAISSADVDFSHQNSFKAELQELSIGVGDGVNAYGSVKLGNDVNIRAETIRIGVATTSSDNFGDIEIGDRSVINTPNLEIAVNADGQFVSGSLEIGTNAAPVNLTMGVGTEDNSSGAGAFFWVTGPLDAHFADVTMGVQNSNDPFARDAKVQLFGGQGGNIQVGSELQRTNVLIGANANRTDVDFGHQSSFTAHVNNFSIGIAENNSGLGFPSTKLTLPAQTTIDAQSIRVGYSNLEDGSQADGALILSGQTKLIADELAVGVGGEGSIEEGPIGFSQLQVGESSHPTRMIVGRDGSGNVELETKFNADLSELRVGEAHNWWRTDGSLIGAEQGHIQIGSAGSPGNLIVGKSYGTGSATGNVDLSKQDRLDVIVDRLEVGVAETGSASGTLLLPRIATINANEIVVGDVANGANWTLNSKLELGQDTVIHADRIVVGRGSTNAQIVAGWTDSQLMLGEPNRRIDLTITETNFQSNQSQIDLTKANTTAYLGEVLIGQGTGTQFGSKPTGRLSFGPQAEIDAKRIVLAQGESVGTLDFKGGRLTAGEITKGTGNAQFNWTGGRLEVGQFGTAAIPFNLSHFAEATLAVPDALAATHIYGNYINGGLATIEIGLHSGELQQIVISDTASLKGALAIQLEPGFDPAVGDKFTILSAASVAGKFVRVTGFYAGDTFLNPVYHPSYIELQAYRSGDGNLDGFVDGADYTTWSDHFLKTSDNGVLEGDYNGDGLIDGADYVIWADHFSTAPAAGLAALAVPEPSAQTLAAIGILLMAAFRRRRWIC